MNRGSRLGQCAREDDVVLGHCVSIWLTSALRRRNRIQTLPVSPGPSAVSGAKAPNARQRNQVVMLSMEAPLTGPYRGTASSEASG